MQRVRTSSVTNVSAQTLRISTSLDTTSPASARHTSTCMTLGSTRTVLALDDRLLSLGATNQSPTWKSLSTSANSSHCTIVRRSQEKFFCFTAEKLRMPLRVQPQQFKKGLTLAFLPSKKLRKR